MIRLNRLSGLTLALLSLLVMPFTASAQLGPGVSLFTYFGERQVRLTPQDPLLLLVTLENSAAASVEQDNQRNQRILDQYAKTEDYQSLNEQERAELALRFPIVDPPEITLGSAQFALSELVQFQVRNADGENVDLAIQPLASNETSRQAVPLVVGESYFFQFAAAADQIAQLPHGDYLIVASLDTRQQQEMWQGVSISNTILASIGDDVTPPQWMESDQRAMMINAFLFENRRYTQAEQHARDWIDQHPDSIDAWGQLGAALAAQEKPTEALEALNTAVAKFRLKHGDNPAELPLELVDKIDQLEGLAAP